MDISINVSWHEDMRQRLLRAAEKYERRRRELRKRRLGSMEVLEQMPLLAEQMGYQVHEMSVSYKIVGKRKDRAIYVSRRGARVELSGFSMDGPAFSAVAKEEARRRHLGNIQARISLSRPQEEVLGAYLAALGQLDQEGC
jgi:hypothetical protein